MILKGIQNTIYCFQQGQDSQFIFWHKTTNTKQLLPSEQKRIKKSETIEPKSVIILDFDFRINGSSYFYQLCSLFST